MKPTLTNSSILVVICVFDMFNVLPRSDIEGLSYCSISINQENVFINFLSERLINSLLKSLIEEIKKIDHLHYYTLRLNHSKLTNN